MRTDGTGANTMALEVQISQSLAAADATKIGLSNYDSSSFTVAATGFVTLSTTGAIKTLTGNSGGAISPVANNINTVGTGSITIAGAGNTLTTQLTGLTNHAVLVGAGTATITNVGPTSTSGQILQSAGASADPAFSTATYPSTTTINQILYSSAANTVSGITAANNGTLISGTTGVPSWLANGTTGQVLTATTGSPPSWQGLTLVVTGQRFTASGAFTYTPTANMKYVIIELQGAGGGGGGTAATTANVSISGAGSGGGYARFVLTAAQVGASLSGSVGAAGTAGASGNNAGGNGGNTTLATTSAWTASGGTGGAGGAAATSSTVNAINGGTVTTGTGTILMTASGGQTSNATANTPIGAFGMAGGSSILGTGAPAEYNTVAPNGSAGAAGTGFGGGAGGANSFGTTGPFTGTAGQPGVAVFTEFCFV